MRQRILLGLAILFLALFFYNGTLRPLSASFMQLPALGGLSTSTVIVMLFSLAHALYALGWRNTVIFFVITAVVSWAFEQVGVATGVIYGAYHYTDVLGTKLGHVPLLIPIAWFMMIYPSYVIANLIAVGQPTGSRGKLGYIIWLSFLGAVVMTAWDLVVDPVLSGPKVKAWVWEQGGPYFGIPVQNYLGWLLTTFTVYLLYRLFERARQPHPDGPVTNRIAGMPLVAYGAMMLSNVLGGGGPEALVVIGPFVMGLPLVAAADRLFRRSETSEA